MLRLDEKVAILSGGASGIGEASARVMAALGATVVIADVDEARSDAIVTDIRADGGNALSIPTDIMSEHAIRQLMSSTMETCGRLDILMNSAGIPRSLAPDAEVAEMSVEWWNTTFAGHVTSSMLNCKYAIPCMIAGGGGSIINTSSMAAFGATLDQAAYSVSKAGVNALSREVAATYGRDNIRCNTIVPGAVLTPRGRATMTKEMFMLFASETPVPYVPSPVDLGNVVAFLASDFSRAVNGQTLSVNGGLGITLPYWQYKMRKTRGAHFEETMPPYEES